MTTTRRLSAGLIAVAMLASSAMADAAVPERHALRREHGAPVAHSTDGHVRMSAPHVDQPGGVCDHGDNPMVC